MEIIVRPHIGAGWRIEIPRTHGRAFVVIVANEAQALSLAATMCPDESVTLLPSTSAAYARY
jgi:hypothetical protein